MSPAIPTPPLTEKSKLLGLILNRVEELGEETRALRDQVAALDERVDKHSRWINRQPELVELRRRATDGEVSSTPAFLFSVDSSEREALLKALGRFGRTLLVVFLAGLGVLILVAVKQAELILPLLKTFLGVPK